MACVRQQFELCVYDALGEERLKNGLLKTTSINIQKGLFVIVSILILIQLCL
jgi:hypothetical protein